MKRSRGATRARRERGGREGRTSEGLFTADRKTTTLRWAFNGNAATSATYGETVWSGNGLSDPGLSSSASQPVGFDQYALWYNRYHVTKSKLSFEIQIQSTAATPVATACGARIVVYPSNTSATATSYQEACAQPRAHSFEINLSKNGSCTRTYTSKEILGFSDLKTDSTASAGVAAQPTAQWYWHIGVVSGAYSFVETVILSHIDYVSEFYYRVTQPLSLLEKLQKEMSLALKEEIKRRELLPYTPLFVADDVKVDAHQETKVLSRLEVERTDGKSVSMSNAGLVPVPLVQQQKNERFVVLNTPSSMRKALSN